jgi:HSP20 family protein
MRDFQVVLPSPELGDLAGDIERLFADIEQSAGCCDLGECRPLLDVVETDETIDVVVDLPGVASTAVRVLLKRDLLVVAGHKPRGDAAFANSPHFHLVERVFGRFARVVRLNSPFDGSRASARLEGGELRVVLPKIHDRRGQSISIDVTTP